MTEFINYIKEKYNPTGIIVYGSFADGLTNEHSDFDALVITESGTPFHDGSTVNGTQLDVFVYPEYTFDAVSDPSEFIQIYNGRIVLDKNGTATKLYNLINEYIENIPSKTIDEILTDIQWCEKMLLRSQRSDAEGMFRWHWLLIDSLEIFFEIIGKRYIGPKKSLKIMRDLYPDAYTLYEKALKSFTQDSLSAWISYIKELYSTNR